MTRRDLLRAFAAVGFGATGGAGFRGRAHAQGTVRFQVVGRGPVLFAGPPIGSAPVTPLGDPMAPIRSGYLERLTDRYQVVLLDYPPTGQTARDAGASFTPDRVCADILSVADAVGAPRFAWYGYSWGGLVGLQLAIRSDRLTALVCGGFAPLGTRFDDLLGAADVLAARAGVAEGQLMSTFYRALQGWRDGEALARLTCPRLVFAGADDVITVDKYVTSIGPLVRDRRDELERLGWRVRLVDGFRHELFTRPDVVVPIVREFLDPILLADRA
jgi:pimeloyl-ACP methyl ester carboxylesterase